MNWKRRGMTRLCPTFRHYSGICMEGMRKTTIMIAGLPGRDLNPGPPECQPLGNDFRFLLFLSFILLSFFLFSSLLLPSLLDLHVPPFLLRSSELRIVIRHRVCVLQVEMTWRFWAVGDEIGGVCDALKEWRGHVSRAYKCRRCPCSLTEVILVSWKALVNMKTSLKLKNHASKEFHCERLHGSKVEAEVWPIYIHFCRSSRTICISPCAIQTMIYN